MPNDFSHWRGICCQNGKAVLTMWLCYLLEIGSGGQCRNLSVISWLKKFYTVRSISVYVRKQTLNSVGQGYSPLTLRSPEPAGFLFLLIINITHLVSKTVPLLFLGGPELSLRGVTKHMFNNKTYNVFPAVWSCWTKTESKRLNCESPSCYGEMGFWGCSTF